MMIVYDALASTTAGDAVLSAQFSDGSAGDAAAAASAADGNVVNAAVNTYNMQLIPPLSRRRT